MDDVRVEVRGLTKRFGQTLAVDDLGFEIHAGKVTGFLGPNGAGKTTTLRMLLGLARPTAGVALVNGVPYRDLPHPSRVVGAILESSGFHPARTARRHLRVVATASRIRLGRVDEVLDYVGLTADADRPVGGYSTGMRQRLELARALLGDPRMLILDEPASGLDPQGIAWLRGLLQSFAAQGGLVLISSHQLAEVAQTVDDLLVLQQGRLVGQGPLTTLLDGSAHVVRVRTPQPDRLVEVLRAEGLHPWRDNADVVQCTGASAEQVGTAMARAGIVVLEMTSSGASLEDLFFSMTGEQQAAGAVASPVGQRAAS